jgi:hypothetical protein
MFWIKVLAIYSTSNFNLSTRTSSGGYPKVGVAIPKGKS